MRDNNIETIETTSRDETFELAKSIGMKAQSGQIYLLSGDLGTGKTVFAQGFAEGLGIDDIVNSPTFTIMQIYDSGRMPLYHFDTYRIGDISEMEELGYEEYFYGNGVVLIEWPEMIDELIPEKGIWIRIEKNLDKGFDYRIVKIKEGRGL